MLNHTMLGELLQDPKFDWEKFKFKAFGLSRYIWLLDQSKQDRMRSCANYLEFKQTVDGELKLHMANLCQTRLCPLCAKRRSNIVYAQLCQITDFLKPHGLKYIHVVLTVRNPVAGDLSPAIDGLLAGFRKLMVHRRVKRAVHGWFRSLEVTKSERKGEYHPHIHLLAAVKPDYFTGAEYIDHAEWVLRWRECMSLDYDPSVRVMKVKGGKPEMILPEIAKYTVKPLDLGRLERLGGVDRPEKVVYDLDYALRGRRLNASGGLIRDARATLRQTDDNLVYANENASSDHLGALYAFRWNRDVGHHVFYRVAEPAVSV